MNLLNKVKAHYELKTWPLSPVQKEEIERMGMVCITQGGDRFLKSTDGEELTSLQKSVLEGAGVIYRADPIKFVPRRT